MFLILSATWIGDRKFILTLRLNSALSDLRNPLQIEIYPNLPNNVYLSHVMDTRPGIVLLQLLILKEQVMLLIPESDPITYSLVAYYTRSLF